MKAMVKKNLFIILVLIFSSLILSVMSIGSDGDNYYTENDDYSMMIASFLNDGNFTINESDSEYYPTLFKEWGKSVEYYSYSGYMAKNGSGELSWYAPTYSIACIPLVCLFNLIGVKTEMAFAFTNMLVLVICVYFMYRFINCSEKRKRVLVLLCVLNPASLYVVTPSAECFIYSILLLACTFWYNKEYKKAALFLSIAGTMNIVVMILGFFMIGEFFVNLRKKKLNFQQVVTETFKYGSCYLISLLPPAINGYNTGHINLTASYSQFTDGTETVLDRFFAYIFDLNFGFLPFYPILLIVSVILIYKSIRSKNCRYFVWLVAFLMMVGGYSIITHINCGMFGISRYNCWGIVPFIFAVALVSKVKSFKFETVLIISSIMTIVFARLNVPSYMYYSPTAEFVLDNCPALYNPLHSTFNSRTNHIDGGYEIDGPVIYVASDGYVRKILANSDSASELLANCHSENGKDDWFEEQVNSLGSEYEYINIQESYKIVFSEN